MKRCVAFALVLLVAGIAGGASSATAATDPPPVVIALTPTRTSGSPAGPPTVTVSGTATVPDGALLAWEVTLPRCSDLACYKQGLVKVKGGAFSKKVRIPQTIMAAGSPADVWVAFQTITGTSHPQPRSVVKAYGASGERITGTQVTGDSIRRAEVTVQLPDEGGL